MDTTNINEYIEEILQILQQNRNVRSDEIPNIDLYMDQVTTFMEQHLDVFRRTDQDKILTKTMINNYSKYKLLPPTVKKKYTNEHIILMLMIYHLKPVLSISDIKDLLDPLKKLTMEDESTNELKQLYDRILDSHEANSDALKEEMLSTAQKVRKMYEGMSNHEAREVMELFTIAYTYALEASAKKYVVTKMIDDYFSTLKE